MSTLLNGVTDPQSLIEHLGLEPHPEGGFYRQTYRAEESVSAGNLPKRFGGDRCFSTAIYFLLPAGEKSRLHRIKSDEVWHFYLGGPLKIIEILPTGQLTETVLGQNLREGHCLQYVVKAGHWFGAIPAIESKFSLVGCTVAPGFDFVDFEMGARTMLIEEFPNHRSIIENLTD